MVRNVCLVNELCVQAQYYVCTAFLFFYVCVYLCTHLYVCDMLHWVSLVHQ